MFAINLKTAIEFHVCKYSKINTCLCILGTRNNHEVPEKGYSSKQLGTCFRCYDAFTSALLSSGTNSLTMEGTMNI